MTELPFLTATELTPLIQSKKLSPVDLTKHILNRIQKTNQTINAYITTQNELARKQTQKAEDDIMNGQYKGPLHGIPLGIKDNYSTEGIQTTAGTKLYTDHIPTESATAVTKLLSAGGIMVGKLNMHQQ